ncbi:uncharacterized protein LOC133285099 [Gastrolobium bilobum]|uniref:uncharacterized protein LOC133285099 n=1 Tax=Gastrolobium bilobum TaxID=150636 RepID=UPI002AB05F70|nr:uncharacterized protein LOC133285099 [Gastrolobium bilobum]
MDNNRRKKSTSGDSFSFPSTPNQDSDFEFGSLTPESPSSYPCRTSPADHLFFNGFLQPHSFPLSQQHHPIVTTSRTSSINSKDSLLSSRSNSTNSRGSSSCSSARTSSSDSSERRLFHNKVSSSGKAAYMVNRSVVSQRWQYITPVPALNRDVSKRRRGDMQQGKEEGTKRKKKKNKKDKVRGVRLRFGRRIFRWFVMACRECHAMEPSKNHKKEIRKNPSV